MKNVYRYIFRIFACFAALAGGCGSGFSAYAAEKSSETVVAAEKRGPESTAAGVRRDSVEFHFRQGRSELIAGFAKNREGIYKLNDILNDSTATAVDLKGVSIVGTASPEGSVSLNENLSRRRAQEIVDLFPALDGLGGNQAEIRYVGRDWRGLRAVVEADRNVPYRDEVLALLDEIIAADIQAGGEREDLHNLRRLQELRGGEPYAYMYAKLFPDVRRSTLYLDYRRIPRADLTLIGPSLDASVPSPEAEIMLTQFYIPHAGPTASAGGEGKNFYMGVKSNLLYDALALPSIGLEFYLGKNISVVGNWTYGWWSSDARHRYWRAYGGDLALRWWFGKKAHEKPLTGHHLGIFAGVTTYDFELGGRGIMGGIPGGTLWDRCMKLGGIEYGYSLPIARRFNLDMTIGLGYLGGKVVKYVPTQTGYMWESTRNLHWFGPVKAEVSLVWLIGRGNENRKGGER